MSFPAQGEIYFADFGGDPTHRVIVVSREETNHGKYVVIIPLTSVNFEERSTFPSCIVFNEGEFRCTKDCVARADQITHMAKSRLQLQEGVIDTIDEEKMREIIKAIGYMIASDCEPD